jgi:hypothetical protein
MFDPIQGPAHPGQGPSTGDSTEHGDTWHAAVAKINAGFAKVKAAFETGFEHIVETIDPIARKEVSDLREELAAVKLKLEAMEQAATEKAGLDAVSAALGGTSSTGAAG